MRARHPTAVWWLGGIAIWSGLAGLAVIEAAIYARWFCVFRTTWRGLLADRLTDWYSYRRYRDREGLALQLRASLSDARLQALRAQINPHFLFNTLNAATALIYRDAKSADRMHTARRPPPRHTEKRSLARNLAARGARSARPIPRHHARPIRWSSISDVQRRSQPVRCARAVVRLQPLVENAFEHGVNEAGTGSIRVDAEALDETLVLSVCDDGSGIYCHSRW